MTAEPAQLSREDIAYLMREQGREEKAKHCAAGQTIPVKHETSGEDKDNTSKGAVITVTLDSLRKHSYNMLEERNILFARQEPLLGRWLSSGTINMIHGGAGKGKTWVLLGSGLSLATGKQFVPGWEVHTAPLRVLMVDGEMPPDQLKSRKEDLLNGFEGEISDDLLENLVTISNIHRGAEGEPFLDLSKVNNRDVLTELIEDGNFSVVLLDNLSCLIPGVNIKASEEYSPFNMWLNYLKAKGITVIFVHHDNKKQDFTGANEMTFALQTRLHVKWSPGGFKIKYAKFRHGPHPKDETYSLINVNDGLLITTGKNKGTILGDACKYMNDNDRSAVRDAVRDYLVNLGHNSDSVARKIRDEIRKENGRFGQSGDNLFLR